MVSPPDCAWLSCTVRSGVSKYKREEISGYRIEGAKKKRMDTFPANSKQVGASDVPGKDVES